MSEQKKISIFRQSFKPKGRIVADADMTAVQQLLAQASLAADSLIENLHRIQDHCGCLPVGHLAALAKLMKLPYAAVYEVATFYHHFDVVREDDTPPPPITVRVCNSLSCEMFGATALYEQLQAKYGEQVRIKTAPCIGRCAEAPAAVVGHNALAQTDSDTVAVAIAAQKVQAVLPSCAQGYSDYCKSGGYAVYADCLAGKRTVESVIEEVEKSSLRGLGGAGFPTGRKWRIVRGQEGEKIVAVNIDEGEPGTFKDRVYLEQQPHCFLEGALIAAWVVGAKQIYIYLRDEYHGCRLLLEQEMQLLRQHADFPLPELHLRRGAGAYICGEESAMIESIEGKRGEPRLRPPYVAEVGVFNRPTLEHNMETLHWITEILSKGHEQFAAGGRRECIGLRSFSVSGRVARPGVHRAPAGISVRELIDEYCGGMLPEHEFYAYLPGGASGGILPAAMGDIPLDFNVIQQHDSDCFIGSAAVIVLSQHDSARQAAYNMMRFFADESCGQCTPCRVGTVKALALMQEEKWDAALLEELSQTMVDASICGLGQAAPNPVRCVIKHFNHEIA